ncbi:MAG: hypothetical protein V4687_03085 [Bacteroidota bacterium]
MQRKQITIEITISQLPGKTIPEDSRAIDSVIDNLYDFTIDGADVVDIVHITSINGQITEE